MGEPRTFDPAAMGRFMTGYGHGGLIGLRYLDAGPDWCDMAIDWTSDLVGDPVSGIMASGPIITLMDSVTSMAVWIRLGRYRPHATVDLRIDYLRPSPPGQAVVGHGECYRLTRTIAFVRGIAHNGDAGDPVAHVTGTFMNLEQPAA